MTVQPSEELKQLPVTRFVVSPRQADDPRSQGYLTDAHALGVESVEGLLCQDLYFIEGQVHPTDLERIAQELLSDPITQHAQWGRVFIDSQPAKGQPGEWLVEVALRPGVTDPVAEQVARAARVLGIEGVERASTGLRFVIHGAQLTEADVRQLTRRLLANHVIHRYTVGEIEPAFPLLAQASGQVETISLGELDEEGLLALSNQRRAALDLVEMQAIQNYYQAEGREPSDVEFETIAQTWSEHCVHKTFKARITIKAQPSGQTERVGRAKISNLLNTFIRAATDQIAAPWVRSAFVDNAGIIDFDERFEVSFKVETHNHPSAIEPFGGANTGVGGVIRDVLGVSAKPIAATDILCFGPPDLPLQELPEGVLHPRRIRSGVVAGVQDYGNKIGIPTVNGAILYDPGFTANPLVFCGCVGIAPKDSHPRQPLPGDRVIVLGGRTGRDGLRGATFSSMTMDGQTGEVSGASVQIGDPITEKGLIEVVVRARDARLYHAVTDCGAGGLSSAVGEMSAGCTLSAACGADIDLQHVRLKYPGLAPWEIWLSEAQERMVLAVPPESLAELQAICDLFDVELTDLGVFDLSGRLVVRYQGRVVLDLSNEFLHKGIPQRHLEAIVRPVGMDTSPRFIRDTPLVLIRDYSAALLDLLASPDIASKAAVIRIYDHEVQGGTVVKPLTGAMNDGPSDACVLKPMGTTGKRGLVLSNGINPQYGKLDPYRMAFSVIDEAVRNAVAVGADPQRIALLDNFCWGDPTRPETLGTLVEAARGCLNGALHYGTPFISGKDSLNNEYLGADGQRHAIPPTLLISAIGIIEDVEQAVTMDLKQPGSLLYLVGQHQPVWGGSRYTYNYDIGLGDMGAAAAQDIPVPDMAEDAPALYQALHQAMRAGLVRACHDLSEGGLAVAAAEMCIAGRLGLSLKLERGRGSTGALPAAPADPARMLFGETNGCLLVEVALQDRVAFEMHLDGLTVTCIGEVSESPRLQIIFVGQLLVDLPVDHLVSAWQQMA